MGDEVRITVIATGFERIEHTQTVENRRRPQRAARAYQETSQVTQEYPPPNVQPRAEAAPVAGYDVSDTRQNQRAPLPQAMIVEDAHMAQGSAPVVADPSAASVQPQGRQPFPEVHPDLRKVLAEMDPDSELDVPTFVRRAQDR